MIINLLGYTPDADPTIPGSILGMSATVPSLKGFKGAPSDVSGGMATLAATCQGASTVTKIDLTTRLFAGAPTKLYEAGSSTWSDVSRAAAYTIGATGRWRFAQQGNVSFAVNGADTLQASVSSGAFSDVGGAPVAAIVENVGNFVFALNTSANTSTLQWSALNDYTTWTASINTQAGNTTLTSSPGPITAGRKFGNALIVFKKTSMYFGTYSGPPNIWDFNLIPGVTGALSQEVVVDIGTAEYPKLIFMGEDDFWLYDGSKPVPIGTNRVNKTIYGALLQSRYYTCTALHDRKNFLVYFYYPVADSVYPDHCVVYNYRTDKWGVDDRPVRVTTDFVTSGITYAGLGGHYATYDDLPNLPYDQAFQNSSLRQPAFFDTNSILRTLTGASVSSSIALGDMGDDVNVMTLNRVRPRFLTAPTSAYWSPQYRMVSGGVISVDNPVTLNNGTFDFIREARWHRGTMIMNGDWEAATISIEGTEGSLE